LPAAGSIILSLNDFSIHILLITNDLNFPIFMGIKLSVTCIEMLLESVFLTGNFVGVKD